MNSIQRSTYNYFRTDYDSIYLELVILYKKFMDKVIKILKNWKINSFGKLVIGYIIGYIIIKFPIVWYF
jgi:hypothetical protein